MARLPQVSDFAGEWALVTGASAGIGAVFARELAARKVNLVLVARREDRLRQLAEDIRQASGVDVRCVALDLAREDFLPALLAAIEGIEVALQQKH
jgi:short-subunit dehydrogenase